MCVGKLDYYLLIYLRQYFFYWILHCTKFGYFIAKNKNDHLFFLFMAVYVYFPDSFCCHVCKHAPKKIINDLNFPLAFLFFTICALHKKAFDVHHNWLTLRYFKVIILLILMCVGINKFLTSMLGSYCFYDFMSVLRNNFFIECTRMIMLITLCYKCRNRKWDFFSSSSI